MWQKLMWWDWGILGAQFFHQKTGENCQKNTMTGYSVYSARAELMEYIQLFCSLRNQNRSQKNTITANSVYSHPGIVLKERALVVVLSSRNYSSTLHKNKQTNKQTNKQHQNNSKNFGMKGWLFDKYSKHRVFYHLSFRWCYCVALKQVELLGCPSWQFFRYLGFLQGDRRHLERKRQTDGRTNGQTDRQTDLSVIIPRLPGSVT